MKYWGYFAAKLLVVVAMLGLGWIGLNAIWPKPEPFMMRTPLTFGLVELHPFGHDLGFTAVAIAFGLACVGVLYLAFIDQRYRCRTCLRRLRMPVLRGDWNHFLLGAPHTEYICPFGHGTLSVAEAHFAGDAEVDWHPIDDMWKELEELDKAPK